MTNRKIRIAGKNVIEVDGKAVKISDEEMELVKSIKRREKRIQAVINFFTPCFLALLILHLMALLIKYFL